MNMRREIDNEFKYRFSFENIFFYCFTFSYAFN